MIKTATQQLRAWPVLSPIGRTLWLARDSDGWNDITTAQPGDLMFSEGHSDLYMKNKGGPDDWTEASNDLDEDEVAAMMTFARKAMKKAKAAGDKPFVLETGIIAGKKVSIMSNGELVVA